MEFEYSTTVEHCGTLFYVSPTGNQVYFVVGGCVIAVTRPTCADSLHGGLVKFGLMLFGPRQGSRSLSEYVDSELRRRGMRRGSIGDSKALFIDGLDMINQDPSSSERDLCGHHDVVVRDPCIAEYVVSMGVSSGLIITAVCDVPSEKTLRVLEDPIISNAYSGFMYDVAANAFSLAQLPLTSPSQALCSIIEGVFDGIPANRASIGEDGDVPNRINVIITAASSAKTAAATWADKGFLGKPALPKRSAQKCKASHSSTSAYGQQDAARKDCALDVMPTKDRDRNRNKNKRSARICGFVQVKYIPALLNIWIPREEHAEACSVMQRKSLSAIWSGYCRVSEALDLSCEDLSDEDYELVDMRTKLADAAEAVFGYRSPPFVPPFFKAGITTAQKFLILQYVQYLQGRPNCFGYLFDLCQCHSQDLERYSDPPIDRDAISDLITECFRGCAFLGAAVEIVVMADHRSPEFLKPRTDLGPGEDACLDADLLLSVVDTTGINRYLGHERPAKVTKLAKILECVYRGDGLIMTASKESKYLGSSELLCAAIDVTSSCAFEKCDRLASHCTYSSVLIDSRLKLSKLPSFY